MKLHLLLRLLIWLIGSRWANAQHALRAHFGVSPRERQIGIPDLFTEGLQLLFLLNELLHALLEPSQVLAILRFSVRPLHVRFVHAPRWSLEFIQLLLEQVRGWRFSMDNPWRSSLRIFTLEVRSRWRNLLMGFFHNLSCVAVQGGACRIGVIKSVFRLLLIPEILSVSHGPLLCRGHISQRNGLGAYLKMRSLKVFDWLHHIETLFFQSFVRFDHLLVQEATAARLPFEQSQNSGSMARVTLTFLVDHFQVACCVRS